MTRARSRISRRGSVGIGVVLAIVITQLVIVMAVIAGSRQHDLTFHRVETARAFFAAEAGVNMAVRELVLQSDADGDGAIGTISNDGNSANDPQLGSARVVVTQVSGGGSITLTSRGRCGTAVREIEVLLQ